MATVREIESQWLNARGTMTAGELGVRSIVYDALHDALEREDESAYLLAGVNVRFFDHDKEITRNQFAVAVHNGAGVEYERNTVRDNGVSQICLTVDSVVDE